MGYLSLHQNAGQVPFALASWRPVVKFERKSFISFKPIFPFLQYLAQAQAKCLAKIHPQISRQIQVNRQIFSNSD